MLGQDTAEKLLNIGTKNEENERSCRISLIGLLQFP